ncbi:MAG: M12 family metallo-peptidase [Bacteroidota bacterium]
MKKAVAIAILLIGLFAYSKQAVAQESTHFIEVQSEASLTFTEEQQTIINNLTAIPEVDGHYFAEIGNLMDFQDSGRIVINFSNQSERSYLTLPMWVDFQDASNYTWMGNTSDNGFGAVLHKDGDGYSGFMHETGDVSKFTRIVALSGTLSIFVEFDLANPADSVYPSFEESEVSADSFACGQPCPGSLHILFLLTPDAEDHIISNGGTQKQLNDLVNELRYTWRNSEIHHNVTYDWDFFDWNRYSFSNCEVDADSLSTNPVVGNLRDAYNADIVILIPGPDVMWFDGFACAADIGPSEDQAFIIFPINQTILPNYTFSHEIGHLYGVQHTPAGSGDIGDCAFANVFRADDNNFYATVMSTTNIDDRIPYFSDPDIFYRGAPTGILPSSSVSKGAMNAHAIRARGCIVGAFRVGNRTNAFFDIEKDRSTCQLELTANVLPNNANYTYEWYWSFDGFFSANYPGQYLGAGATASFDDPTLSRCKRYFIQLVVKLNGVVVAKTSKSTVGGICDTSQLDCSRANLASSKTIQVPINNLNNNAFPVDLINIYDINGRLIKTITKEYDFPTSSIMYGEGLNPGMYFIQRQGEQGDIRVDKLIVL